MNRDETVKRYIDRIGASARSAARRGRSDQLKRGLDAYRSLIQVCLNYLKATPLSPNDDADDFDAGVAANEIALEQVGWVKSNYWNILDHAFSDSGGPPTRDSVRHILYFPYAVAVRSLRAGDWNILNEFLPTHGTNPYVYHPTFIGTDVEDIFVNRLGRHPFEFANFQLGRFLEDSDAPSEVAFAAQVARRIIGIFNSSLKHAFDAGNLEHFSKFLDFMRNSFTQTWWEVDGFQQWRRRPQTGARADNGLPKSDAFYEAYDDLRTRVSIEKSLVEFGLAAWVVRQIFSSGEDVAEPHSWLREIGDFGDINEVLRLFVYAVSELSSGGFGWSNWIATPSLDMSPDVIDFDEDLGRLVVIKGLKLGLRQDLEYERPDRLEDARTLAVRCREGGVVNAAFESLVADGLDEQLEELLGDGAELAIQRFRTLLDEIVVDYEEFETERIVGAEFEREKVEILRDGICVGYESEAGLKDLFALKERYRSAGGAEWRNGQLEWRGINSLVPKEMFLEDRGVGPKHYGEDAGKGVSRGEDFRAWELFEERGSVRDVAADRRLIEAVDEVVEEFESAGLDPVIVLANAWDTYSAMLESERFDHESLRDSDELPEISAGQYGNVSVYRLRIRKSNAALICDFASFGEWVQVVPEVEGEGEFEGVCCDYLKYRLQEVDVAYARLLLEERPDEFWEEDEAGERLEEEEAIRRLRRRARFELYSCFDLDVENARASILLREAEKPAGGG